MLTHITAKSVVQALLSDKMLEHLKQEGRTYYRQLKERRALHRLWAGYHENDPEAQETMALICKVMVNVAMTRFCAITMFSAVSPRHDWSCRS